MVKKMQKKNKKKRKINKKGLIVILLTLYLVIMVFSYLFTLPVKNIIIKGNNIVSDNDIISSANIKDNTKLITLNRHTLIKRIEKLPLIENVEVKKYINGKLVINVKENKVLFYNTLNNTYVLNNKEEITSIDNILGIPVLINYVPSDIYDNLIKKMDLIDSDILALVSEIEYNPDIKNDITIDENRFLLRMNDGNYAYINLANFTNLNSYKKLYATIDELGVFNLDSSSDKIVFKSFASMKQEGEEENELP